MDDDQQPQLFPTAEDALPPDPLPDASLDGPVPQLYLASALTRLGAATDEQIRMVESEVRAITEAVGDLDLDGGLRFHVDIYAPIEHSSAHRHADLLPEQVFRLNCHRVLTDSDGLIVHGWEPGAGVGQEFAWATAQLAIPVLWLRHRSDHVSRQVRGTAGDVTFATFETPSDLRQAVRQWARSRRAVLQAGPSRRATRALRWRGPVEAARGRWRGLRVEERQRVCAMGHIHPEVIELYLSEPLLLATAPAWLVDLLTTEGLLVATTAAPRPQRSLTTRQMFALAQATMEYEWEFGLVDILRDAAEQLIAQPAKRRLRLETPADWARFRESLWP